MPPAGPQLVNSNDPGVVLILIAGGLSAVG
jgi:hypothetical protein